MKNATTAAITIAPAHFTRGEVLVSKSFRSGIVRGSSSGFHTVRAAMTAISSTKVIAIRMRK